MSLFNVVTGNTPNAILDSGATSNFGQEGGGFIPTGEPSSKVVGMANGQPVQASQRALLPMSNLRQGAREGDILPGLHNSLVSVSKFADEGYVTIFEPGDKGVAVYDANDVKIELTGDAVVRGWRDPASGLWRVPLTNDPAPNDANSVLLREDAVKEAALNLFDLPSVERSIRYLHACLGFPTKATWLKAIRRGNFVGWPLVTVENVNAYFPECDETPKGHLNQQRQGVRSTKRKVKATDFEEVDTKLTIGRKEKDVYIKVVEARELRHTIYSDQSGRFPVRARSGNQYLMVLVEIDSNCILVEPMKSKKDDEMQRAYLALLGRLKRAGVKIEKHVLDNEVSNSMKDLIRDTCTLELVPPGCHRRNVAEVAIKTFKNHFISILAGVDATFPMNLWDKLLPQAELTLNLLRQSNSTPTVSAYAHLFGPFDFYRMPLAPLGCPVQVHEPPANRRTYAFHSKLGWNLGVSLEHYRCSRTWVKATQAERISETVFFKHKYITNPSVTHADVVVKAAQDLRQALMKKANKKGEDRLRGLQALSEIFLEMANNEPPTTWETEYVPRHMGAAPPRVPDRAGRVPRVGPTTRPAMQPSSNPTPLPANNPVASPAPRVAVASDPTSSRATPRRQVVAARPPAGTATPATPRSPAQVRTPLENLAREFERAASSPAGAPPPTPAATPATPRSPDGLIVESEFKEAFLRRRAGKRELKNLDIDPEIANLPARRRTRTTRSDDLANALIEFDNCCVVQGQRVGWKLSHNALNGLANGVLIDEMANAVLDEKTGKMLNYRQLLQHEELTDDWMLSSSNEYGRLAQGVGSRVKGTETIFFIHKHEVPADRFKDVTYVKFVCTVRPQKAEKNRTRMTLGGDRINYPGDVGTPTADLLLAKILFNSVISTKGAKFMTLDIKDFYLNTPLERYEYVKIALVDIPQDIIDEYGLMEKATPDGYVYTEVRKGMYGLPHAGLIAQELLEKRLNKHGYYQDQYIPGLWAHETRNISFTLVVDDFGVKYTSKADVRHLLGVLTEHYTVSKDWSGGKYIGLTLDWDYAGGQVHLSMPGYVAQALVEFGHEPPASRQDSPHPHTPPKYGATKQYAEAPDESPLLDAEGKKFIQRVCGKFLYYGRAVDSTLLVPLSAIAAQQSKPTEVTLRRVKQLLDYVASQEEAVVTYKASDMVLGVHSDAGYLNETNARSRAGGHFFLSNNDKFPPDNGAILNIAQIIKAVMSSAAEAELGALYINAREAVYIRLILERLGHPQPPTPMQTDNSTAAGIILNKVQPKRTKHMDMRFYWLRDRKTQKMFRFYWRSGKLMRADYYSKHHPAAHHRNYRPEILTSPSVVMALRKSLEAAVVARN